MNADKTKLFSYLRLVAVGTSVAGRPPHRPVLAILSHTVPTLEISTPSQKHAARPPSGTLVHRCSLALCPASACAWESPRPTAFPPHTPPGSSLPLVRMLRQYYAVARLPTRVHLGRTLWASPSGPRSPRAPVGSPGSRAWNFQACLGSLTARGSLVARVCRHSCCGLPLHRTASAPRTKLISQLHTLPACAPVNASPVALRRPTHDSGSGWFAIPFL